MAALSLKALLSPKTGALPVLRRMMDALGGAVGIEDPAGKVLAGESGVPGERVAVMLDGVAIGAVSGGGGAAAAVAALLEHLAAKEAERRALAAEVLHLYREIHLIEQLSEQLAALLDFGAVGQAALDQARRLIPASDGVVLLREGDGLRVVASFGNPGGVAAEFVESLAERADMRDATSGSRALLGAPLRAKQRTVGMIALAAGESYSSADLKLLNTIALQAAAAFENALLCSEMVDAVRDREHLSALQKELDTARTIQHSLVPRAFPAFPERRDFDLHAQMTSAKAVGGDFFDFFLIDERRLGLVIGDVSGKGIPAALYMAVTRTQIKTTALQGVTPPECLQEVNRGLVRDKVSAMFATCFYGILDTVTGELHYCNAGHNPPYLVRCSGEVERVPMTGGIPLGVFGRLKYAAGEVRLGPGDALFLYTDGVTEASNAVRDEFTEERLVESLRRKAAASCREMIEVLADDVVAFTAGAPQSDDITMLALRRAAD